MTVTQRYRLGEERVPEARLDYNRTISFLFNGRRYYGHPGDTLASALIANGVSLIGRSFKYHRPRGFVGAGHEDPNGLVQLETGARTVPNIQAARVPLYDGLTASSVNCWPSVEFDLMAVNSLIGRFIPAGFYYKTFMWPPRWWKDVYEPRIRAAAGLGRAPEEPDPDIYDKMNAHADVLVVGGGPAGLSAALAASRAGARVILCDEQVEMGGALLFEKMRIDDQPAFAWVEQTLAELADTPDVTVLTNTQAFGLFDHNFVGLVETRDPIMSPGAGVSRQRLWRVRAREIVLATGALERPLVFADNDRPGVMLAGAVRQYVNRYGAAPGKKAVIFTNNDDAYRTALDLYDVGIDVAAVIDVRPAPDGDLPTEAAARGVPVMDETAIVAVHGKQHVSGVDVMDLNMHGSDVVGERRTILCDLLAVSGGWNPVVHLHSHSGGKNVFEEERGVFLPGPGPQNDRSCGAANGEFALQACINSGAKAGRDAAGATGHKKPNRKKGPAAEEVDEGPWRNVWLIPGVRPIGRKGKHFIDQQNDVTAADVMLAAREGYESIEHAKRYTTMGMATDQGKTGNLPGMATLAKALGKELAQVGATTFRPPYTPLTFGVMAGRDVGEFADVTRQTPLHAWHEEHGAVFEDVGQWKRPWYYPKAGEGLHEAVHRECLAVRKAVGVLDATTLGKIDIQGPDAAEFLNRVYTNKWDTLKVGRCRYGLMCKDDGMVFDDGVTTRLGENHFHMTTTSGGAATVMGWLEEWLQTEWPELRVYCTSVTEQWAVLSISGPKARDLLWELTGDIDLDPQAFPFMSMREGAVSGAPARVFRISFTGESSFEINVPASAGKHVWQQLMTAGAKYGVTPYGTEAMHVLRAEKGFIITGQDTDATMTPADLGMDWIVSKTKPDFIGKRAFSRPDTAREDRKQLVGLLTKDSGLVLPEGAQIVATANVDNPPTPMLGHVTSSYASPSLNRSIALAVVKGGRARTGETVYVPLLDGRVVPAEITDPVFYDKDGERARG